MAKGIENIEGRYDIDFELWVVFERARSALSRSRELELAQYGLTLEQAGLLYTLQENGGSATNADIALITIRQYNSVTTLVNRMEKIGLLKKQKSADGKRIIVATTPKGRSIYQKISHTSIKIAFSDLTLEDKERLFTYLSQIVAKSRDMLGMDKKLPFLNQ